MEKEPFDIHMWLKDDDLQQDELTNQHCAFYLGDRKVGEASIKICSHASAPRRERQFYPDSWFSTPPKEASVLGFISQMKPFLEIKRYDFSGNTGKGFGHWGLQKLYSLSCQLGTEGRISLDAENDSGDFYEHCGFSGNIGQKNGRKYFDPTPKNLQLLFSKKADERFILKKNVRPFKMLDLKLFKQKLDSLSKK